MKARWLTPTLLALGLLMPVAAFAAPAAAKPAVAAAETTRPSLDLADGWEAVSIRTPSGRAPAGGWTRGSLPWLFWSEAKGGSSYAWYRRKLPVPAAWRGKRVFLRLAGAKFDAHVYLDGKLVGTRLEGYTPWEIELKGIRAGATHRLEIRCQDWGATFADGHILPADVQGDIRYMTGGRTLAPIGGVFYAFGLWDGARLEARPAAYLDDIAITPSVRNGALVVTGAVAGGDARPSPGKRTIDAAVLYNGKPILHLAATRTGSDGRWRLGGPFPEAPRWSPETPNLLSLRLSLRGAGPRPEDVVEIQFGFRELWAEGADFLLNGVKRHLLATSTWPATVPQSRDQVREVIRQVKAANSIAMRLHTQPWREVWLEEADALGLMIIDEAALWCDGGGGYAYKDPRFWENYRAHVTGMVRRDRNHASLVMWSLENELLHCGGGSTDPGLEGKLADLGKYTKALDPGHLITYEADLDPGGAADVIGLHYPHELPDFADWPDTANWLGGEALTGTAGGLMGSRGAKFKWDKRKPLYIGEYLWVPDGTPAAGAIYYGDEAYLDTGLYNKRAKARSWEDQAVAYRAAGVSGQCPWTMFEGETARFPLDLNPSANIFCQAQAGAYVPAAAYLRECDTWFYRGSPVTRTFDVFNDTAVHARMELGWGIGPAGPNGTATLFLEPGGHAVVPIQVSANTASSSTLAVFSAVLTVKGYRVHESTQPWVLEPPLRLVAPRNVRVRLFDPSGTFSTCLAAAGLKTKKLKSLDDVAKLDAARDLVVMGPGSLGRAGDSSTVSADLPEVGRIVAGRSAVAGFLARGGRLLVLEQDSFGGIFPGVNLVEHAATMAFPVGPDSLLRGIGPNDLKFWHPGHYVSRRAIRRPGSGGARSPVVTGNRDALDLAPVIDLPVGPGRVVLVQLLAGEKLATEPAAGRLIQNALDSLASPSPLTPPAAVIGSEAFAKRVEGLGVRIARTAGTPRDLATASLVIADGALDAAARDAIGGWLTTGGGRTLYWHEPDPASFNEARGPLGFADLDLIPAQSPLLVPARLSPVLAGIPREDLYFLGGLRGEAWERARDADPSVIAEALVPVMPEASGTTVAAVNMSLSPADAGGPAPLGGGVALWRNGALSATVTILTAGLYPVTLVAGGTPARGGWPLVEIRANGAEAGRISLTRSPTGPYAGLVGLPAGDVKLELAFVNDTTAPGEDRNILIRSITIAPVPWTPEGYELLALPAALVLRESPGKRVLVDCVRWPGANAVNRPRADRYASALFANLGAGFAAPAPDPDWVPAGAFKKVGEFENFSANPDRLYFGSNGAAEAPFTCATAGRYGVCFRGSSTPLGGIYGRVRVTVDEKPAGEIDIPSENTGLFETGASLDLTAGPHTVRVEFLNDEYKPPEDRNLEVTAVGFRKVTE